MKKKALALIMALLFSAVAGTQFVSLGKANPFDLPVDTGIRIISTNYIPYQDEQYENSTVTLNIEVILVYGYYDQSWAESVHLDSICYSLDGQPLIYTSNFAIENHTNYGRDEQDFLQYSVEVKLENLSEGSHTVTAYANHTHNEYAYINDKSASYNFTVNSHKQVADVTQTSPEPTSTPEPQQPESFPSTLVIASVITAAVYGIGLMVYFKKRKR